MKQNSLNVRSITRIGIVTALMCVIGPLTVPIPFSPVNITLIQICMYFSLYALGTKYTLACTTLYLFLGAVGMPVFSGYGGGFYKIAGPTGGYLIGYIFLVAIAGAFIDKKGSKLYDALGIALGNASCYLLGTLWLSVYLKIGFFSAVSIGVLPYIIPDALKAALVISLSDKIRALADKGVL